MEKESWGSEINWSVLLFRLSDSTYIHYVCTGSLFAFDDCTARQIINCVPLKIMRSYLQAM